MLVGRGLDLGHVQSVIDQVGEGRGAAVVLVGRPGVGKTALLDEIPRLAPAAEVVRATGVEAEADLPWAALATLLEPLVDDDVLAALAPPRAAALRRILLLDDSSGALDLRAVAVATLDVVTARARADRPVLLVVDDLHWVDAESRRALQFLARRIGDDPVGVLAASREPEDLPQRTVLDLDPTAADELLAGAGVTRRTLRDRLVEELGTNPLLLVTAARGLPGAVRSGEAPVPAELPLPESVTAGAREGVGRLAEEVRTALLVLATAGSSEEAASVDVVARAVGAPTDRWDEAVAAGVVAHSAGGLVFTHPTLRTAVVDGASTADRRRTHRAWAEVTADAVSRARHASRAVDGPDAAVADALAEACDHLLRRGALATSAAEMERAAALSPDRATAARRLARAAEAHLARGDRDAARPLLDRASAALDATAGTVEGAEAAALVERLLARQMHQVGEDAQAVQALRALADRVAPSDPEAAVDALLEAMVPLTRLSAIGDVVAVVATLEALAPRVSDEQAALVGVVAAAARTLVTGEPDDVIGRARAIVADRGLMGVAGVLAGVVAPMVSYSVRSPEVLAFLREMEDDLRAAAAVVPLIWLLGATQAQHHGRSQTTALLVGDEAITLATEIGAPHQAFVAASGMAVAAANAGDEAALARARTVLDVAADGSGRAAGLVGAASLALSTGRLDDAIATYEQLHRDVGMGRHVVRWEPEYVEALARARRFDDGRAVLALALDDIRTGSRERFARSEALLQDDPDDAIALLATALAGLEASGHTVGVARTELCWGEVARRARRRSEARVHLERACDLLEGAGATPWLRRAQEELVLAGGTVATGESSSHDLLTIQELRIARLAAAGATNREAAAAVFLSERTIEAHLSAVYRKLQVRGRRGLAARALEDPTLREPA